MTASSSSVSGCRPAHTYEQQLTVDSFRCDIHVATNINRLELDRTGDTGDDFNWAWIDVILLV